MLREEFIKLAINEQVSYFNECLRNGLSINKICSGMGISKSISSRFKKKGYNLIENQFIFTGEQEHTIKVAEKVQKKKEVEKTEEVKEIKEAKDVKEIEFALPGRGRPPTIKETNPHTIIIHDYIWEEIAIYAIRNKMTASETIEMLAIPLLKSKKDK